MENQDYQLVQDIQEGDVVLSHKYQEFVEVAEVTVFKEVVFFTYSNGVSEEFEHGECVEIL